MSEHESKSEMARLLRRIELEYQAIQRALTGPALGAARHEFIRARNENIGRYHEQLIRHERACQHAFVDSVSQAGGDGRLCAVLRR